MKMKDHDYIELCAKISCTGCFACEAICKQDAIVRVKNDEGFLYPEIQYDKCISCHACQKVCPVLNPIVKNENGEIYAAWALDESIRNRSSSGGIFSILAESILHKGGIVVGASLFDDGYVKHTAIYSKEGLQKLRGSKYVQSIISNQLYGQIKTALKDGREVLFCGTPCQVAAMRNIFKKYDDIFYTIDLVCHGVPSPDFFAELYKKIKKKIPGLVSYQFRDYKNWQVCTSVNVEVNKNGKICNRSLYGKYTFYQDAFLKGYLHRDCCYSCYYTSVRRISDITLADFWGIGKYKSIKADFKGGCSMVSVNTSKGHVLMEEIKRKIYYEKRDIQETIDGGNEQLVKPSERPLGRDTFYIDAKRMTTRNLVRRYGLKIMLKHSLASRVKRKIRSIYKGRMNSMNRKRVSIITIFDNPNFGTYLQALALGLVLKMHGAKAEIVHYERPIWHVFPKLLIRFHFLEPLYILKAYLRGNKDYLQRLKCRKFVSKYIDVTKTYYSYEELKQDPPKADIYMTGSDQVWNTIHNHGVDKSFYLGYVPQGKPKYAYAASIGMSDIPDEHVNEMKKLLSQYDKITVREKSNVNLLSSIGIFSEQVLDPTLLLNKDSWNLYARHMHFTEPYLLVYSVESKERDCIVGQIARKVANLKGLKIYEVNYLDERKAIPGCDRHFFHAVPDIFLALLSHASYVVVSSFHGTAFAINFNKDFLSVLPDRFSSRLDGLLKMTKLENRKVSNIDDVTDDLISTPIDFSEINSLLEKERKRSICILSKMVND